MIKKTKNGKWSVNVTLGKKVNDSHDKNVKHFNAKTEVENYECSLLV